MPVIGKILIVFGFVMVCVGTLMLFYDKIPYIGKLPGDINIKRDNFQLYFPITTSIVISLLINLIFWLINLWNKSK